MRLKELGYLDDRSADAFFKTPDITLWTDRFRRASGIAEPSFDDPAQRRFGQLVLRAYAKEEISLGRVAELLNVDRSEARKLAWLSRPKVADLDDVPE